MLKILTVLHTTPDVKSYRTLCFRNLLPVLKRKTDVHITWLVYKPEKLNLSSQENSESTIIDIHDYKNAVEVVQKVKPDIIWVAPTLNLPDYALSLAGKFCNIPVVGELVNELFVKTSLTETIKLFVSAFFQSSVPTDTSKEKKIFMKRGRFFVYKYLFLLRTQKAIKMSMLKIIQSLFKLAKIHLLILRHLNYSVFACDLHFVESEKLMESLIKDGFERSTLVVTGNPIYDSDFQKIQKLRLSKPKDGKIRVLLLTHAMYEHGVWTRKQRDSLVRGIVTEICKHQEEISLVVKIHPSSEILSEYQSIIHPIDPDIPIHQKGEVIEFLAESDVVISYSTASALINALVLKKPIIICNLYNLEGDLFLEKGLVLECDDLSNLILLIKQSLSANPATQHKIDSFIMDLLYKLDGLASERIGNAMFELIEKNTKTNLQ